MTDSTGIRWDDTSSAAQGSPTLQHPSASGGVAWDDQTPAATPAPTLQPPGRSLARAVGDTGLALGQGAVSAGMFVPQLANTLTGGAVDNYLFKPAMAAVDRLTGGPGEGRTLAEASQDTHNALEGLKSDQQQAADQSLNDTHGFLPTAKKILTSPSLMVDQLAQQVPQLVAPAGITRKVGALAFERAAGEALAKGTAKRVAAGMTEDAAKQAALGAANRVGQRAAIGAGATAAKATEAAMSASQNSEQAQQEVLGMDQAVLDADPKYQALIAQGATPQEAREARAHDAGLIAGAAGGAITYATGGLTAKLESRMFQGHTGVDGLSKLLTGQGAKQLAIATGKEAAQEGLQEGGEQFGQNVGVKTVDPNTSLMDQVPEQAALGGVIGGVMGGGTFAGTAAVQSRLQHPRFAGAAPGSLSDAANTIDAAGGSISGAAAAAPPPAAAQAQGAAQQAPALQAAKAEWDATMRAPASQGVNATRLAQEIAAKHGVSADDLLHTPDVAAKPASSNRVDPGAPPWLDPTTGEVQPPTKDQLVQALADHIVRQHGATGDMRISSPSIAQAWGVPKSDVDRARNAAVKLASDQVAAAERAAMSDAGAGTQPDNSAAQPDKSASPFDKQASEPDAGSEQGTTASIPVMITQAMKRELRTLGHTDADIAKMTPQQAHDTLRAGEQLLQPARELTGEQGGPAVDQAVQEQQKAQEDTGGNEADRGAEAAAPAGASSQDAGEAAAQPAADAGRAPGAGEPAPAAGADLAGAGAEANAQPALKTRDNLAPGDPVHAALQRMADREHPEKVLANADEATVRAVGKAVGKKFSPKASITAMVERIGELPATDRAKLAQKAVESSAAAQQPPQTAASPAGAPAPTKSRAARDAEGMRVKTPDGELNGRAHVDQLVAQGYNRVESTRAGDKMVHKLVNAAGETQPIKARQLPYAKELTARTGSQSTAASAPALAPDATAARWDAMSADQRTAVLRQPGGWGTGAKAKAALNPTGKKIAGTAWANHPELTRKTIARLLAAHDAAMAPTEPAAYQKQQARDPNQVSAELEARAAALAPQIDALTDEQARAGLAAIGESKPKDLRDPKETLRRQHPDDVESALKAAKVEAAAAEAASSPHNDLPEPTDAQKEAGVYKKGHVWIHGLDISIENPRGSTRSGVGENGKPWSHEMSDHYGYIRRTEGADGEHVDLYIGPNPASEQVFVVDQLDQKTGGWDEHKVMLGFDSEAEAVKAYRSNFDKGWKVGPVHAMSMEEFKAWLKDGDTSRPAGEHVAAQSENAATADAAPPAPAHAGKIDDLGEKIGGARKDTSVATGSRGSKKAQDDRPAWAKRWVPLQDVRSKQWMIVDQKTGRPVRAGSFDSMEAAEKAVPLYAVSVNHRASPVSEGNWALVRDVTDRKRVTLKDGFPNREAVMRYMAEHAGEILAQKTGVGEEVLAKPEKAMRTGEARRQGDVAGKDFMDTFGFRGVEFGNWNNQAERQEVMNHAFDGLHDLAEVIGVPPRALSLNGELALAFGARGQGLHGARAHYERDYGVMNLTKMQGAGALAHEWFHALDHYLGRQDGKANSKKVTNARGDQVYETKGRAEDYLSHSTSFNSKVRPELVKDWRALIDTMFRKAEKYVRDTAQAESFVQRARDTMSKTLDNLRQDLARELTYGNRRKPATPEQLAQFDKLTEPLRNGHGLDTEWKVLPGAGKAIVSRHTNDILEGLNSLLKAVRNRQGFNAERRGPLNHLQVDMHHYAQRIKMLEEARAGDQQSKQVPTRYAMDAKAIDQGRASDYWTTHHEMAARAFSAYVEDKLGKEGRRSDFLSYGSDNKFYVLDGIRPFPEGEERQAIDAAFDRFFGELKAEEGQDGNVRLFSLNDKTDAPVSPFYSAALRSVEEGKGAPKKADAAGWKGWLDGAVRRGDMKQTEREWLGIDQWLSEQSGPVTRDQLATFVRDNQVQIRDVTLANDAGPAALPDGWTIEEDPAGGYVVLDAAGEERGFGYTPAQAKDDAQDPDARSDAAAAKFSQYTLPGGRDYRELLLTLPNQVVSQAPQEPNNDLESFRLDTVTERQRSSDYRSTHFDQPNVLAHVRFNERTDADGKRVLFLEEVQSDWHQQGRRHGYVPAKPWEVFDSKDGVPVARYATEQEAKAEADRRGGGFDYGKGDEAGAGAVPDAPLKGTNQWSMLAFRRMVAYAAEHGFDRIAWTTGEQQAARYDLSKQIASVRLTDNSTGGLGKPSMEGPFREGMLTARGHDGREIIRQFVRDPAELPDLIGKEATDKLLAQQGHAGSEAGVSHRVRELSGLDLKLGGEGMRAFYDQMLPKEVGKWGKAFGAKVATTELPTGEHDVQGENITPVTFPAHSIELTPAMREAALGGLPLFRQTEPGAAAAVATSAQQQAHAARVRQVAEQAIARWKGDDRPGLRVVATPEELPAFAKRGPDGRPDPSYKRAAGMYDGRTIWIVASAHQLDQDGLRRILTTMAHEGIGHYGVDRIVQRELGADAWGHIEGAIQRLRADKAQASDSVRSVLESVESRYGADASPTTFARETLAVMAERGVRNGLLDRVLTAVRRWLRRVLPNLKVGEAELRQLLVKSKEYLERGPTYADRVQATQAMAFSQASEADAYRGALAKAMKVSGGIERELPLGRTTEALKRAGLADYPMVIKKDTVLKATRGERKPELRGQSDVHDVRMADIERLPEILAAPVMVMRSRTQPDSAVVITDAKDLSGRPVVVALHTNRKTGANEVHRVASVYGKDGVAGFVREDIRQGRLLYRDTKKSPAWLQSIGLQLPGDGAVRGSWDSVPTEAGAVKPTAPAGSASFSLDDRGEKSGPNQPAKPFSRSAKSLSALQEGVPKAQESLLTAAKGWLSGKARDFEPKALGALQLRHVLELMEDSKLFPAAKQYAARHQQMDADRQAQIDRGSELTQKWQAWAYQKGPAGWLGKLKPEAKNLARFIHDVTQLGIDPTDAYKKLLMTDSRGDHMPWTKDLIKDRIRALREQMRSRPGDDKTPMMEEIKYLQSLPAREKAREAKYPELVARWNALPDKAKEIFRMARDRYQELSDLTERALLDRVDALSVPETYKRSLADRIRFQFEANRVEGVYFPLSRFGDYWISGTQRDGQQVFGMFENYRDAEQAIARLKAAGVEIEAQGLKDSDYKAKNAPSGTFVADIIGLLQKSGAPEKVQDEIYQMFLKTLPELSMRKHGIHRKNIAGFSDDALRAFAKNNFHSAHQIARLKHGFQMEAAMEAMETAFENQRNTGQLGGNTDMDLSQAVHGDALLGELKKRHDWIMSPKDSQMANVATSVGYLYYMSASPAAALVNLTQGAQVTLPVLGAHHGWPKAMRELGSATKDALRTGGNIQRVLRTDEEQQAFKVLEAQGTFQRTATHTLAGIAEGNTLTANPAWAKVMNAMGFLFHKAEVVNREAAGVAAFRLARGAGQTFEQAVRYADEIVNGTHFDYSNANRARYMQGNVPKILFQFKNYSVGMSWVLYRNLYKAMKGETPEVRRLARRTLTGVLGMTGLFAGVMGLPIINLLRYVANAAHAVGGDDDEPWDFNTEFRSWLAEHLGENVAQWVADGAVNQLTGANVASRVSLSDLWFRDADRELEGKDAYYAYLEAIAGPLGGIAKNMLVGSQMIGEGHMERGVETILPKFAKDAMKAVRFASEGSNTLRGDPIVPDVSVPQTILQSIGFQPTELREQQRVNSALMNYQQEVKDRRQLLMNAFAMAQMAGDEDGRSEALAKIRDFNARWPEVAIRMGNLHASLRAREQRSAQAENGIMLDKRLAGRIRQDVAASAGE